MPNDTNTLPEGAGAASGSASSATGFIGSGQGGSYDASNSTARTDFRSSTSTGSYYQDEHDSGYRSRGRAVILAERSQNKPNTATVVGAALVGAIAGAAIPFMLSGRSNGYSSRERREDTNVEESVTINRSPRELYDFWRDFTNLPRFMDNIKSVEKLDEKRSHWVIKAPAGTSVEFDSRVVDDVPGKLIAWESEEGASVPNRGRVEFLDGPSGSTTVRTTISYDPPAGVAGKMVAKLFQREPATQARQDLRRLKELMEAGRSVS